MTSGLAGGGEITGGAKIMALHRDTVNGLARRSRETEEIHPFPAPLLLCASLPSPPVQSTDSSTFRSVRAKPATKSSLPRWAAKKGSITVQRITPSPPARS